MMAANRHRIRHLANRGNRGAKNTQTLLSKTEELLSVILIGNNIVNTILPVLLTAIAMHAFGNNASVLSISTGVAAVLIIIFCEITPKVIGATYPERFAILEEIYHFRNGHWQFVQKYIMANTKYAMATGGTPITSWIPNQILSVIRQMEDVIAAIAKLGATDQEQAKAIYEKNATLLPTKKGLIDGQLALIHNNDFSAEAVFALNQKFGYDDTK